MNTNKLNEIKQLMTKEMSLRKASDNLGSEKVLLICGGTGCCSANSLLIKDELENLTKDMDNISVKITGCFGFCAEGPIVQVYPDDVFYTHVTLEDTKDIIEQHIKLGNVVERLLFLEPTIDQKVNDA